MKQVEHQLRMLAEPSNATARALQHALFKKVPIRVIVTTHSGSPRRELRPFRHPDIEIHLALVEGDVVSELDTKTLRYPREFNTNHQRHRWIEDYARDRGWLVVFISDDDFGTQEKRWSGARGRPGPDDEKAYALIISADEFVKRIRALVWKAVMDTRVVIFGFHATTQQSWTDSDGLRTHVPQSLFARGGCVSGFQGIVVDRAVRHLFADDFETSLDSIASCAKAIEVNGPGATLVDFRTLVHYHASDQEKAPIELKRLAKMFPGIVPPTGLTKRGCSVLFKTQRPSE